ncbi:glycoside hydrolase family 3 N-terminal domain-containing protein [Liquorilactobacillus vini]|uniref:Beta-glucosidase n=2 Tax=Bacteria TaxID=2 RepID=A0A0R2BYY5_9LACO|nr:glycoside hydrolase family 3 N-terminal domain-containing protein [Liquorilactobacillus vini]KRM84053.1 beta-glucosidase [Liquorilactobacillus vini DSM 20605]
MNQDKLADLFHNLSWAEKIGQLVQLSGDFFGAKNQSIGPAKELGISPTAVKLVGSVLNVAGTQETVRIQKKHLSQHPHQIPLLFMADILYGYKTIFPSPLGLGATWNPTLIQQAFQAIGQEAQTGGINVAFGPMVDLVRDARWGRVMESTGEDVYLNSQFARSMVTGLQHGGVAACIKHFAGYGAVEGGREYNSTNLSPVELYQHYLPAYRAGVKAGAYLVMTSLTALNGRPCTANEWLLKKILREKWGFKGVIISDFNSIKELIAHGLAADEATAAKLALQAGVDIDMKSPCYAKQLEPLVKNQQLDPQLIDQAAWRVLCLKNKLGLFEDPYRHLQAATEPAEVLSPDKQTLARKVAQAAVVMLKNEGDILPLHSQQRVAVIGPYADNRMALGMWAVHADYQTTSTLKEGLEKYFATANLKIAPGTPITLNETQLLAKLGIKLPSNLTSKKLEQMSTQAYKQAAAADVIIFAGGESSLQSGEAGSRTDLHLPANQLKLLQKLAKLDKPIILINYSGRPLVLTKLPVQVKAILQVWYPGTRGGQAIADILVGQVNPSGRLSISFPAAVGQCPIYYNHLATGRPKEVTGDTRFTSGYLDAPAEPLYPFGYGLSYGQVVYHQPQIDRTTLTAGQQLRLTIKVTNNSKKFARLETVQLYLHDIAASIVQPVKQLIDFRQVALKAQETVQLIFTINEQQLGFYDETGERISEPGDFELMVGPNSAATQKVRFTFLK